MLKSAEMVSGSRVVMFKTVGAVTSLLSGNDQKHRPREAPWPRRLLKLGSSLKGKNHAREKWEGQCTGGKGISYQSYWLASVPNMVPLLLRSADLTKQVGHAHGPRD